MTTQILAAHRRSRSVIRAGAVLAAVLVLSGCSAGAHIGGTMPSGQATASAASPSASAASAASPSSSASASAPSSAASTTSSGSYRSSRCLAEHLVGTLAAGEGGAGSTVDQLVLRNTGGSSCTLQGWPGVSFIDGGGRQVGAAAVLDRSSAHQTVTLLAGGRAQAPLKIGQALNFPKATCEPVTVRRLRVYPPGSTESIVIGIAPLSACSKDAAAQLTVQAFLPAS